MKEMEIIKNIREKFANVEDCPIQEKEFFLKNAGVL